MIWKTMALGLLSLPILSANYVNIKLSSNETLYCLKKKKDILIRKTTLKRGQIIRIPKNAFPQIIPLASGERDTTGFYPGVKVKGLSVLKNCRKRSSFYITGTIPIGNTSGIIEALPLIQTPDSRFKEYFNTKSGQPKREKLKKAIAKNKIRFSYIWNKEYKEGELSSEEIVKSTKILKELAHFANRSVNSKASMVYLDSKTRGRAKSLAEKLSIQSIENYGFSPSYGAWDVAVIGTAKRLGFGHAPCAEFMSEVIRQAYTRANYNFEEDFPYNVDDRLIFTWDHGETTWGPQSVKGLSERLMKANWIAWDPTTYRPTTGAIAMAWYATTPGHAYIISGLSGQMITDNGNPLGLDLRVTEQRHKKNHLKNMYVPGVFFLPKGITPEKW